MHPTEFANLEFERAGMGGTDEVLARTWELARRRNRFVWSLLTASLSIYFGILIIIVSSPDAMSQALYGEMNVGLAAIIAQVLVTIATFWAYCVWAAARFDPLASALRDAAGRNTQAEERHV